MKITEFLDKRGIKTQLQATEKAITIPFLQTLYFKVWKPGTNGVYKPAFSLPQGEITVPSRPG